MNYFLAFLIAFGAASLGASCWIAAMVVASSLDQRQGVSGAHTWVAIIGGAVSFVVGAIAGSVLAWRALPW